MVAIEMKTDMNRIAFLDDRKETAETVVNGLMPFMPLGWEVVACPMLADPSGYAAWITSNQVAVFIVDQLLNEAPSVAGKPVWYKGNNVLAEVRKVLPELPLVVATRATEESELMQHLGDADEIVSRTVLVDNGRQYVKRFLRLGQKFIDTHADELEELSTLSVKSAVGDISESEKARLRVLQTKLNMASNEPSMGSLLSTLEREIVDLERLSELASAIVQKHSHNMESKPTQKKPQGRRKNA